MRRAARTDANQAEIVEALRKAGASVHIMADVGQGVPDLLVGRAGCTYLLEVKAPRGRLNEREQEWHASWRGQVAVVYSREEALRVIGAL